MNTGGWIAVDLDGTVAMYSERTFPEIGAPIPKMINRIKGWLELGRDVRIFTARVGPATDAQVRAVGVEACETQAEWLAYQTSIIEAWCKEHIGQILPITATKDFGMAELWDDRAVQVLTNTGTTIVEDYLLRGGTIPKGNRG